MNKSDLRNSAKQEQIYTKFRYKSKPNLWKRYGLIKTYKQDIHVFCVIIYPHKHICKHGFQQKEITRVKSNKEIINNNKKKPFASVQ